MQDPGAADAIASPRSSPPPEGRLARLPFHWLLFAAYPVLFLYAQNIGELEPVELLIPLAVVVGLATVGFVVLSRLIEARRAAIIVSGLVILLAMYGPISDNVHRFVPLPVVRLVLFACAAGLVIIVALRLRGGLGTATLALDLLSVVLVAFSVIPIAGQVVNQFANPVREPGSGVTATASGPGTTRDIWWIILDRYGSDRSLRTLYDITDNDFGPWLESKGFRLLPDAHANYVRTSLSLASTLHMTHLDGLAQRVGADSEDYLPVYAWLKDHPVGRFLKEQGYRFTQLGSWFPPTRSSDIADVMLRPGESRDFGTLVRDASVLSLLRASRSQDRDKGRAVAAARYQWDQLARLCREVDRNFVFAHVLLPHPPYVFRADGTPAKQPTSYAEQLRYTNDRIRDLVTCLQDRPADQQPIIVIQGDEGPYPPRYGHDQMGFDWAQATPSELAVKFGILDAMYLPGLPQDVAPPPADLSSVNTFRYLLSSYFGADLPMLPDRSYTSPKPRPYDLTDVTERIPSPGAVLEPLRRPPGEGAVPQDTFEP